MIPALGLWVLREACAQALRWPGVRLAVNMSPLQLQDATFVESVRDVLAETGFPAALLELELTEAVALGDAVNVRNDMAALRRQGRVGKAHPEGAQPSATDTVKVHYRGTFIDGREFDSSYARNEPAEFPLNRVIKGWTEGVALMREGETYQFVIPADLAYGARWVGQDIPPNLVLKFQVELLAVNPAP
jgi:hypothetical protein